MVDIRCGCVWKLHGETPVCVGFPVVWRLKKASTYSICLFYSELTWLYNELTMLKVLSFKILNFSFWNASNFCTFHLS